MESIAKIPEYTPESVPERGDRVPSFRDDVRRTIARHNFRPSTTHYTRQADIYQLFRSDNNHREDTPVLEEKFRSALGRVLRPPSSANAFAKSFAVPNISRWHEYISMVSMDCPCIELKSFIKSSKREEGLRRRKAASANDHIGRLREARRERKLNGSTSNCDNIAQEQHVSFRYVDELLTLNCAEDLLKLKYTVTPDMLSLRMSEQIFPNGKELAESMSAYATVRSHLYTGEANPKTTPLKPITFDNPNITLIAVGDGVTPRTAALFAFRTQWKCISIDPALRQGAWNNVNNLTTHTKKVQDVTIPIQLSDDAYVIVVMWHAHVSIRAALSCLQFDGKKWDIYDTSASRILREKVALVSCACCNYDSLQTHMPDGSSPDAEFEDEGVPGLMRTVRVWKWL